VNKIEQRTHAHWVPTWLEGR